MMNAKRSSKFKLTRYAFVVPAVVVLLLVFTFTKANVAKPISHKIALTIKPVTVALKQATQKVLALTDTVPAKKVQAFSIKIDTAVNKPERTFSITLKNDTVKNQKLIIRSANKQFLDSVNIVLNGKKTSEAFFSEVDPSSIESINIVRSGDIKSNAIDGYTFNNDGDVLFVATKNSEEGKALADKLGKRRQITNIRINGVNKTPGTLNTQELVTINALPGLQGTVNHVTILDNGNLSYSPATALREVMLDSAVRITGNGRETLTLNSINKDITVRGLRTDPRYSVSINNGSVNRISDKLIVIDGKVASEKELKKLSAYDIDRMNTSNSADTVKKYGDKAKYGVVYIYTKKGKKE